MGKVKKSIVGVLAACAIAVSCTAGGLAAFAEGQGSLWRAGKGTSVADSDELGGSAYVTGFVDGGNWAYYGEKVKLDGLTVSMKIGDLLAATTGLGGIGFGLAASPDEAGRPLANANAFNAFLWKEPYENQARVAMGSDHQYQANQITYANVEMTERLAPAGDGTFVCDITQDKSVSVSVQFMYVPASSVWSAIVTTLDDTHVFAAQGKTATVYFENRWADSVIDQEGKCWIVTAGMAVGGSGSAADGYFRVEEGEGGGWTYEEPEEVPEDGEWTVTTGSPYTEYDIQSGMSHLRDIRNFNDTVAYDYKVKLDGLKVTMKLSERTLTANFIGFGLAKNHTDCPMALGEAGARKSFNAIFWIEQSYVGVGGNNGWDNSPGTTALLFGYDHNYAHDRITYPTQDLTPEDATQLPQTSGAYAYNISTSQNRTPTVSLEFHKVSDSVWSVTVELVEGDVASGMEKTVTYYFDAQYANSVLDEEGLCYIVAEGNAGDIYMKVEDDAVREYNDGPLATSETAAQEFEAAVRAISDPASYLVSMEKRDAFIASIENLRPNGKIAYNARLAQIDALYQEEETQVIVKATLDAECDKADAALDALDVDASVTEENLAAADAAMKAALALSADMKNMLTEDNWALFEETYAEFEYRYSVATVTLWVKVLEDMVAGFASSENIGIDIANAKEYRLAYEGSETQTIVNGLREEEKTAFEQRLAAVTAELDQAYEENGEAVKGGYLDILEDSLKADLTVRENLDSAKAYYDRMEEVIEITEDDGELYTRYNAAYELLEEALESYIAAQIDAINRSLDANITSLNEFDLLRADYEAIDLSYSYEENADNEAAYEALTEKMKSNVLYDFVRNGGMESDVTITEDGLYFEQKEWIPARLDYNKDFDIEQGIEIKIRLDEIAYYNANDYANNLCINFHAVPGMDRKTCEGFSIFLWFYGATTEVDIYNNSDNSLKVGNISTPDDGETVTIKVWRELYKDPIRGEEYMAWMFSVNEWTGSLSDDAITTIGDDGTEHTVDGLLDHCYLGIATYMDRRDKPNRYTLLSVNDIVFGTSPRGSEEPGDDEVTGVSIAASSESVAVGSSVTVTASVTPADATVGTVIWYINGVKAEADGMVLDFTPENEGSYTIRCEIDGVASNEIVINAVQAPDDGGNGLLIGILCGVGGLIVIAGVVAFVLIRRKKAGK